MGSVKVNGAGGIQFGFGVGNEEQPLSRESQGSANSLVAGGFALGAGGGVKIGFQKRRQIADGGIGEQEFLGEHAAGRKDGNPAALVAPAGEGGGDVGIDFAFQFAAAKAFLPDFALQSFQRGDLAVAGNQPTDIGRGGREFFFGGAFDPHRRAGGGGATPGAAQFGDELLDFGVVGTAAKESFGSGAGEREKRFEDEIDRRGSAFDVQKDGEDFW